MGGNLSWQVLGQPPVEHCVRGSNMRTGNGVFHALIIHHSKMCRLTAGASGGGHRDERSPRNGWAGLATHHLCCRRGLGGKMVDELGSIDDRAATHGKHNINLGLPESLHAPLHIGQLRIRLKVGEDGDFMLCQCRRKTLSGTGQVPCTGISHQKNPMGFQLIQHDSYLF